VVNHVFRLCDVPGRCALTKWGMNIAPVWRRLGVRRSGSGDNSMKRSRRGVGRGRCVRALGVLRVLVIIAWTPSLFAAAPTNELRILTTENVVELLTAKATRWVRVQPGEAVLPLERLRTGPNSRVSLRWSDSSVVTFGELTEMEVLPPH